MSGPVPGSKGWTLDRPRWAAARAHRWSAPARPAREEKGLPCAKPSGFTDLPKIWAFQTSVTLLVGSAGDPCLPLHGLSTSQVLSQGRELFPLLFLLRGEAGSGERVALWSESATLSPGPWKHPRGLSAHQPGASWAPRAEA